MIDDLHVTGEGGPRGPGPNQGKLSALGNAYLDEKFPEVSRIVSATRRRPLGPGGGVSADQVVEAGAPAQAAEAAAVVAAPAVEAAAGALRGGDAATDQFSRAVTDASWGARDAALISGLAIVMTFLLWCTNAIDFSSAVDFAVEAKET